MTNEDKTLQEALAELSKLQREQAAAAQKTEATLEKIRGLLAKLETAKGRHTQQNGTPLPVLEKVTS